jgi:hypothetical protein
MSSGFFSGFVGANDVGLPLIESDGTAWDNSHLLPSSLMKNDNPVSGLPVLNAVSIVS